jgi:hypothetical protein
MRDEAATRLEKLHAEYDAGQKMLAELEARKLDLQQTLLRISGAIQVLDELLGDSTDGAKPQMGEDQGPTQA